MYVCIFTNKLVGYGPPNVSFPEAPQWMQTMVDFIGRFCWAGITFWIVSSIASIGA